MTKSKLYRNLKPGDKFEVVIDTPKFRAVAVVTVSDVKRMPSMRFSDRGRAIYYVYGDFPFWWGQDYIRAYSDERTELYEGCES